MQNGSHYTMLDVSKSYSLEGRNQVIRRTLIYPDTGALSAEQMAAFRKSIATHSRVGSTSSDISVSRSIRDRAPTPPPNRSSTRKVIGDTLPPVPSLGSGPSVFNNPSIVIPPTGSGMMGSTMSSHHARRSVRYAGADTLDISDAQIPRDAGIELLELSNGQVIWSVVDGLRAGFADENDEDDRSSFTSEFSTAPPSRDETVQLFVRGHQRNQSSKGSVASIPARKRLAPLLGIPRPETKVYFSSTAQISSLIDNISRGLESGSFNIVPSDPTSPFFSGQKNAVSGDEGAAATPQAVAEPYDEYHARQGNVVSYQDPSQISHQANPSVTSAASKHWTMEEQLERTWNAVNPT